ncbi:hypothetical protein FRC17_001647 [Serendipita sp. 399]|nr:hypothetical protein FRC17_001647 [Serendipita sp. 399]
MSKKEVLSPNDPRVVISHISAGLGGNSSLEVDYNQQVFNAEAQPSLSIGPTLWVPTSVLLNDNALYSRNLNERIAFTLPNSEPTLFYGRQPNQVTSGSLRPITTTNEGPSGSNGQSHAVLQTGSQSAQKLELSPFGRYLVSRVGHDDLQSKMLSWVTSFLPRENRLGEGCGPVIVSMKSLKKAESDCVDFQQEAKDTICKTPVL